MQFKFCGILLPCTFMKQAACDKAQCFETNNVIAADTRHMIRQQLIAAKLQNKLSN